MSFRNIPKENLIAYYKLSAGINKAIRYLEEKKTYLQDMKKNCKPNDDWKFIYEGQYIEANNMLVDLKLLRDRSTYHIKFCNN